MIKEKVNKFKLDNGLDDDSSAFIWLALDTILNLNADEILDAITDGAMDGGIDAIYISGCDAHIFNFKYTSSFENSKNNFPSTEMDKVIVTMEKIYGKSITEAETNGALWEKINEIWGLFEKGTLNFKFYFCSNKENPIERARTSFESYMNKFKYVEFQYIDQEKFSNLILETKYKKVDGKISFIDKQYYDRSDGKLKGVVATISATDLVELVKDKDNIGQINENVFNDNVRIYLKLKNRINKGIYETALSDSNYEFWYLNNGITIVCEECNYIPNTRSPCVELKNFQIVNGGQTTNALFEAYNKDKNKIDNVLLLVRICETRDYSISDKISETTNSQNPVRSRDLRSNDRVQRMLEDQFSSLGYFYERKKNQYISEPNEKRLDSELLGQLYLSYYLQKASEARNQKSIVFGESYDEIFNEESITASKMLIPYKIYLPLQKTKQIIQIKKRRKEFIKESDAFISRATFHIVMAVGILNDYYGRDLTNSDEVEKLLDESIQIINALITEQMGKRSDSYTHDKFFKEKGTNALVANHIETTLWAKTKPRVKNCINVQQ